MSRIGVALGRRKVRNEKPARNPMRYWRCDGTRERVLEF